MHMASLLAGVMIGSLILYVLLGGADYGAGVWDLLSSGPTKQEQKQLIANAIRPIWEANHVWLILIFVLLFAGFPRAFGAIMIALFLPLLLMLLGIVLRGSSYVFRAYTSANSPMQRSFAYVFSVSSSFTPVFAGIALASLSDGRILVIHDRSMNGTVMNWLNPFALTVGLLTLSVFSYLAASYLAVEAPTPDLRRSFCHRALTAAAVTALLAAVAFVLAGIYAGDLQAALMHDSLTRCAEIIACLSLAAGMWALAAGRVRVARVLAASFAASIVAGWAAAQYPYLARPGFTIFNSVLAENVVRDIFFASLAGALILFPSLALLFYVFKDQRRKHLLETASKIEA